MEQDYTIDEKHRSVSLTQDGISSKLERTLGITNLYGPENFGVVHHMENALKAQVIFQRDRDYVVQDRRGSDRRRVHRQAHGRPSVLRRSAPGNRGQRRRANQAGVDHLRYHYAAELLQAVHKLAGMTGTAATEGEEFDKIYKLDVVSIPTNRPMVREDTTDLVYRDQKAKYSAVVAEIERRQ